MHKKQTQSTSRHPLRSLRRDRTNRFTVGITSLAIGLGSLGITAVSGSANQLPMAQNSTATSILKTAIAPPRQPLPDGVYLYGQTSEPDQIGAVYMVFEVTGRRTVGAFYMPHSSFDCFRGEFQSEQLSLMVQATYEQEVFPYSVPLNTEAPIAAAAGDAPSVSLVGFQPLDTISPNDERILSTCKAETW
ncbi:MAG: hypothetical protein ACFB8W_00185 [Elainellaceae cyanobacterium]